MLCSNCPHCAPRGGGEYECAWTGAQVHPRDALAPAGLDDDDRHICPLTLRLGVAAATRGDRRCVGNRMPVLIGGVLRVVHGRGLLDDLLATYPDGEAARLWDCWRAAEKAAGAPAQTPPRQLALETGGPADAA